MQTLKEPIAFGAAPEDEIMSIRTGLFALIGVIAGMGFAASDAARREGVAARKTPVWKHSDVIFMYASDEAAYRAYGATFVAWGGAERSEPVKMHHDLGIRCTGSMWCLTAGAKTLYEDPALREAVARDIEGKPIEVSWLFDHTYKDMKTYFGCTNHPAFRAHCETRVREVMSGGADGLHIDDHLGVAQAATAFGGGLCDSCIAGFRDYLKQHATPAQLAEAGVKDLDTFDYRDVIRRHATTRAQYQKVQNEIPLMDLFRKYHLETAAEFIHRLGKIGAEAAGHPILLSANAPLAEERHRLVARHLTHVVSETHFNARQGAANVADAVKAFDVARNLGLPLAVTAFGWDWSHIKATDEEELVRFWIALTYAHGQWFMAPHPKRQWCFNQELGTHWYPAPVEAYAPVYRFIRDNARWLDGFEAIDAASIQPPPNTLLTARRKGEDGPLVLHLLNRDYDPATKHMRPRENLTIALPASMLKGLPGAVQLLPYGAKAEMSTVRTENDIARIQVPTLGLWTLVIVE